ncbi:CBL-interacting protein kinase 19 [Halotydeus destructor]|nr:CBL-interacting protein kinase 19 [Halotydeus destructor]
MTREKKQTKWPPPVRRRARTRTRYGASRRKGFTILHTEPPLGQGGFATIYKGKYVQGETGKEQKIAVKIIRFGDVPQEWKDNCLNNELAVQMKLQHPHILRIFDTIKTRSRAIIFMELAKGSVERVIKGHVKKDKFLELTRVHRWLSEMSSALWYMHTRAGGGPYAHRDLKCENVLLNDKDETKIADFGFTCSCHDYVTDSVKLRDTKAGTQAYMAPEIMAAEGPYDAIKADMYSLGVCLYEMFTRYLPFPVDEDEPEALRRRQSKTYIRLSKLKKKLNVPDKYSDLVDRMLEPDPGKRLTDEQLLNFFANPVATAS